MLGSTRAATALWGNEEGMMSLQNEGMQKGHHLPPAARVAGEIENRRAKGKRSPGKNAN